MGTKALHWDEVFGGLLGGVELVDLCDDAQRRRVAAATGVDVVRGPVPVPDRDDPLVCTRRAVAHGAGPLGGTTVEVERPVELAELPGAEVLLHVEGHVVAQRAVVDGRTVVLCATGQLVAARHRTAGGPHPVPTVVEATSWDLSLLPGCGIDDPDFLPAAGHARRLLPAAVHDALVDFGDDCGPAGGLLVRGAPVGELGPTAATPLDGPAAKYDHVSEFVLLTVARSLGHPVGFAPELGGRLVQDIVPVHGTETRQVSTSSTVSLDWHTEAAFHPHRPRYLVLLCLRGDPAAATLLASARHLARVVDPAAVEVLRTPRFTTMADESYLGRHATRRGNPRAVLAGPVGAETMWFDAELMDGTDRDARWALDELRAAVEAHHASVTLEAGDVLVVDNDVAVHGRTAFTPRFDGTDRWLQRTFVVADLTPSATERTGAVVDTWFLP